MRTLALLIEECKGFWYGTERNRGKTASLGRGKTAALGRGKKLKKK
jgi:hypothetical protein